MPERRPDTAVTGPDAFAKERAVTDHRTNDRASGSMQPAGANGTSVDDRLLRIRRRVADGAYDNAAVIAVVAGLILDSGDLR